VSVSGDARSRCAWARTPASIAYHDREWATPVRDDRTLFEFLVLEGAQAGLSWETILAKRERYRAVFANFEIVRVARFGERDVARLMGDRGIVRNRSKIDAAIGNARAALALCEATGATLGAYLWAYVGGEPIVTRPQTPADIPATTPLSERISKDLKARGFRFVGPTIVYAFMQAVGMVDDHLACCFRAESLKARAEAR
jgi:DNA-3-methyladenine glycosylase I